MQSNVTVPTSAPRGSVNSGTPVSGVDPDFSRYDKSVVVLDNIERQSHPLSASTPAGVEALGLDPVVRSDNLFREAVDLSRRWVDERHLPTVFFSDTPFGVNGSSYVGSYLRTNPTQTVCVTAGRLGKRYVRLFDLPDYAMDCGFSLGAVLAVMVGLMTSHAVSCETARDGSVNLNVKWLNPFCTSSVVVEVPSSNFAHFDCSFVLVALESVNCDVRVVGLLDVLTRPREYGLSGVAVARIQKCLSQFDLDGALGEGRESFSRLANAKGDVFYSLEVGDGFVSTLLRSVLLFQTRGQRRDRSLSVMPDGQGFIVKIDSLSKFVRVGDSQLARALAVMDRRGCFVDDDWVGLTERTAKEVFDHLRCDGLLTVVSEY